MWSALTFLAGNVWEIIDDILVGILVLTVGNTIANTTHYVLNKMLRYDAFIVDMITTLWRTIIFSVCLYQIIGMSAINQFVLGISIGVGTALQGYIASIFTGAQLYGGNIIRKGSVVQFSDEQELTVEKVGLFFTELKNNNTTVIVANSHMIKSTLKIIKL